MPRVTHAVRYLDHEPLFAATKCEPQPFENFAFLLRSLFGAIGSRRVGRVFGVARTTVFRWATGETSVPPHAWGRLKDVWHDAAKHRRVELKEWLSRYEAIVEREQAALVAGRALLDRIMLDDPLAQRGALWSTHARYHRRRQEQALRAPEAAAATAALPGLTAATMQHPLARRSRIPATPDATAASTACNEIATNAT